jgi:hypothetical protein
VPLWDSSEKLIPDKINGQQLFFPNTTVAAPPRRALYGMLVAEGKGDLFLTYCTNAREAERQKSRPADRRAAPPSWR